MSFGVYGAQTSAVFAPWIGSSVARHALLRVPLENSEHYGVVWTTFPEDAFVPGKYSRTKPTQHTQIFMYLFTA
jgi:hypothetical protein